VSLRLEDSENFQTTSIKYKTITFGIRLSKLWMLDIVAFMDMWLCTYSGNKYTHKLNEAQIHESVTVNL